MSVFKLRYSNCGHHTVQEGNFKAASLLVSKRAHHLYCYYYPDKWEASKNNPESAYTGGNSACTNSVHKVFCSPWHVDSEATGSIAQG